MSLKRDMRQGNLPVTIALPRFWDFSRKDDVTFERHANSEI